MRTWESKRVRRGDDAFSSPGPRHRRPLLHPEPCPSRPVTASATESALVSTLPLHPRDCGLFSGCSAILADSFSSSLAPLCSLQAARLSSIRFSASYSRALAHSAREGRCGVGRVFTRVHATAVRPGSGSFSSPETAYKASVGLERLPVGRSVHATLAVTVHCSLSGEACRQPPGLN